MQRALLVGHRLRRLLVLGAEIVGLVRNVVVGVGIGLDKMHGRRWRGLRHKRIRRKFDFISGFAGSKLPEPLIADMTAWVKMGAPMLVKQAQAFSFTQKVPFELPVKISPMPDPAQMTWGLIMATWSMRWGLQASISAGSQRDSPQRPQRVKICFVSSTGRPTTFE